MKGFKMGSEPYLEDLFNNPPMIYYQVKPFGLDEPISESVWR